jgi:aryl-phospho-beta-D-glucosidase BglC (GH1 family)
MLESSFAYINQWAQGKRPSDNLNQATYDSMRSWKMNTLRTNISQWVQRQHTTEFLQQLDTIVAQATASKLYVILDFHDDCQSGSPYCDGMMRSESLAWWKQIATRYKNNNHVMYDAYNEPHYPNWDLWLNGGTVNGVAVVGFKAMIDAIRSTGSKQIIVVEPGSASGGGSQGGGWNGYTDKLTDPNLMYSKHIYAGITSAQIANPKGYEKTWDGEWGSILGKHPMYYGEWAVNPHPQDTQSNQCKGLTSTNADQITRNFLKYLQARDASWTAWDFRPYELLKSSAPDFTSTTFNVGTNWSCGEAAAKQAGMGADVKQFLLKH